MSRLSYFSLIGSLLLLSSKAVAGQVVEVRLDPVLSIGDSDDAEVEYLFSGPRHIAADASGSIYVADGRSRQLRVYTSDGKFSHYIGEDGAAPGEFKDISAMTMTQADELVVLDRWNDRASRHSTSGELIETYPLGLGVDIWGVAEIRGGDFAVNFFSYGSEKRERQPGSTVLHRMTSDFSEKTQSLLSTEDLYLSYTDVPFIATSWYKLGKFTHLADRDGNLLIVPDYYYGTIYRSDAADDFSEIRVFAERAFDLAAAEHIDFEDADAYLERGYGVQRKSDSEGQAAALIRRRSLGLVQMPDGSWVHLYSENRGDKEFFAEVFDVSGTFLGESPLQVPDAPDVNDIHFQFYDYDDQGLIYTADDIPGYPVVRVYALSYRIEK